MTQLRQGALLFLFISAVAFAGEPWPAGSFPLPSIDGKPLAVAKEQKTFRLPMRFAKVEKFYREELGDSKEITFRVSGEPGARVLSLASKRKGERWTKATIKEGEVDTSVDVTQVIEAAEETVSGNGKPLVQFVIGRDPAAEKAAADIDHMSR